jgi:hypothetical protein
MVLIGIHSDRTGERRWHVALSALLAAIGWSIAAQGYSPWLVVVGLAVAQMGMMAMLPTFWALPTAFLTGTAAAGGIALINSVANLGGFFGPNIMSELKAQELAGPNLTAYVTILLQNQPLGSAVCSSYFLAPPPPSVYTRGMTVMAVTLLVGALLALCVRHDPKQERV